MINWIEFASEKSVEQLALTAQENLKEDGFGVLWQVDFQKKFEEKGIAYDTQVIVLEICNPQLGHDVLASNVRAGYLLPCKVTVYESDSGSKIGFIKPTALIGLLEDASLRAYAAQVEETLTAAIRHSV